MTICVYEAGGIGAYLGAALVIASCPVSRVAGDPIGCVHFQKS